MDFATIFILILLAIYGLWKIIYFIIYYKDLVKTHTESTFPKK